MKNLGVRKSHLIRTSKISASSKLDSFIPMMHPGSKWFLLGADSLNLERMMIAA